MKKSIQWEVGDVAYIMTQPGTNGTREYGISAVKLLTESFLDPDKDRVAEVQMLPEGKRYLERVCNLQESAYSVFQYLVTTEIMDKIDWNDRSLSEGAPSLFSKIRRYNHWYSLASHSAAILEDLKGVV